jgi:hypothetical protein
VGTPSKNFSIPKRVSTSSGISTLAGTCVVIFIFGGYPAKAVAMLPAITPAATRVFNNFVFI